VYLNRCQLIGEIARAPDVRTTQGGHTVCSVSLKLVRKFQGRDNEQKVRTLYVDLKAWGERADALGRFTEGALVLVDGELDTESWEDKDTQKKRYKTLVSVLSVQPLIATAEPTRAETARAERKGGWRRRRERAAWTPSTARSRSSHVPTVPRRAGPLLPAREVQRR
jgi:single-strand DNA-binding protein